MPRGITPLRQEVAWLLELDTCARFELELQHAFTGRGPRAEKWHGMLADLRKTNSILRGGSLHVSSRALTDGVDRAMSFNSVTNGGHV